MIPLWSLYHQIHPDHHLAHPLPTGCPNSHQSVTNANGSCASNQLAEFFFLSDLNPCQKEIIHGQPSLVSLFCASLACC